MEYEMKKIILLVNIILLNVNTFAAENLEQIKPNWKLHDKWIVRTWYSIIDCTITGIVKVGEAPCDVTFEVINTNYIGEVPCYELLVTFPTSEVGSRRQYKLFYNKDTYKLLQVIDCYKRQNGSFVNIKKYDYLRTSDTSYINSEIPFDLPDFTQVTNIVKTVKTFDYIQNIKKDLVENTFDITLKTIIKNNGRTKRMIIQKWDTGLPWPKETKKIDYDGKIIKSSFLKRIK